jgi:hypothetical protein
MRLLLAVGLALGVGAACRSFVPATPKDFAEATERAPGQDYRATAPGGLVLAVRALPHDPHGDLTFWGTVIVAQLRQLEAYTHLETKEVQTDAGLRGLQFRFQHGGGGEPHLYQVTLYVTRRRVFVLEAGGPKTLFERESAQIEAFVRRFRPRFWT